MTDTDNNWKPKYNWPNKKRLHRSAPVPYAYVINPENELELIPNWEVIKLIEEGLEHADKGVPLREVADWLYSKTGKKISHQGVYKWWKEHCGSSKDSPRAKKRKQFKRKNGPKTGKERAEVAAKRAVAGAKRSLTVRERKLAGFKEPEPEFSLEIDDTKEQLEIEYVNTDPLEGKEVVFKPNPGPQTDFLAASEQEVLYGGPLTLNTRVVTPTGYRELRDLTVGDTVFTPFGLPTAITDIPFDGYEESYRVIFDDGSEVVASAGHKWLVGTSDWGKTSTPWRTKRTNELLDFKLSRGRNKYKVPNISPLVWEENTHVISPYTLGVLLGDGTFTTHKTPSFISTDQDIINRVGEETPEGLSVKRSGSDICWSICREHGTREPNPITYELSRLDLTGTDSHTKFIPSEYLYDSVDNRIALLRGLMDTDGTVRETTRRSAEARFTTVSIRLKNDFIFLAQSLGFRVTWHKETPKTGNTTYRVLISGETNPFHLGRKAERFSSFTHRSRNKFIVDIIPVGEQRVRCITVEDSSSLFLVEGFTVTHNSAGGGKSYALLADPMRYFSNPNFNGIIFRRTNDELRELKFKAQDLYRKAFPGTVWREKDSTFIFPSGARLWFTYLERDDDVLRYQGQAFSYVAFDELTQYPTPFPVDYMRSRLRTTDPTLPLFSRYTTNPGGPGHGWVKRMFIDPAPYGQAFDATDIETGEVLRWPEKDMHGNPHPKAGQPLFQRRFIPARLSDNPYLFNDGQYEANLLSLSEMKRRQLLEGDWNVADGAAFPEFRVSQHVIKPFEIPRDWRRFRSCDYGYSSYSAVHWYAIDPSFDTLIVYRELYVSKATGEALADMILELEKGEHIAYGILDSSVWRKTGQNGPSVAEAMIAKGVRWREADRTNGSRVAGRNRLHELLKVDEDTNLPGIVFFDTCRQIISDLPVIPTDPHGGDDIDDRYTSDHTYDSIRYGIQSRPKALTPFDTWGSKARPIFRPADNRFGY